MRETSESANNPVPPVSEVLAKLEAMGVTLPEGRVRLDLYGDSEALSEELLELIRRGRKRAGTSLLWAMEAEGDPLPQAGDVEVVLDHRHEPALVTRIMEVRVLPFDEVTAEYAAIEGEGDGSLEHWRQAHWDFFCRDCKRVGLEPTRRMPVICSIFEVQEILPAPLAPSSTRPP
ncbi:MAG: ASCH domain-containing protein [Verrucomicrobiota bacterium]